MIKKSPKTGIGPKIHPTAFIAKDVVIIGDVEIGAYTNVWFGVKIRASVCKIRIGNHTSIQENVVIHSEPGTQCNIGNYIIIGHLAMVHGPCEIKDYSMVGLSSTILQGAELGQGAVLAGGSVLRGQAKDYGLYAGAPAEFKKYYGEKRINSGKSSAIEYVDNGQNFKQRNFDQPIPKEFLIEE
ncbi:MAG: gamma carbonic anhydrase family protein [Candidatus Lokiarchaeota archaeon]|nr:gamma carbonic anhydrase family protein [Candidatus Lokiarchaeota archaeon]